MCTCTLILFLVPLLPTPPCDWDWVSRRDILSSRVIEPLTCSSLSFVPGGLYFTKIKYLSSPPSSNSLLSSLLPLFNWGNAVVLISAARRAWSRWAIWGSQAQDYWLSPRPANSLHSPGNPIKGLLLLPWGIKGTGFLFWCVRKYLPVSWLQGWGLGF